MNRLSQWWNKNKLKKNWVIIRDSRDPEQEYIVSSDTKSVTELYNMMFGVNKDD